MANNGKKGDQRFDMGKLMEMSEPLTVYCERLQGNTSEPIAVPALSSDRSINMAGTPGTGWQRDDVVKLPEWLKMFWSGAGTYSIQVIDSNKKPFEYELSIPVTQDCKQRPAPPMGAPNQVPPSAVQQVQVMQQPQQQGNGAMSVQPPPPMPLQNWGGPQASPMQGPWSPPMQGPAWGQPQSAPMQFQPTPQQTWGAQQVYPPSPYGQQPYNPWGQQAPPWGQPPAPARDPEMEKALKEVQARLEDSKRREIELKYQQDLERQRAEAQKQHDALRDELRRINEQGALKENDEVRRAREDRERMERENERRETNQRFAELQAAILKMGEAKHPEADALAQMREENRRRDEAHQRELEKRDAVAREERIRLEIKESNEKHERMMREIAASQNKGPDPMLELIKEQGREARASQERQAQQHQQQLAAVTANGINPLQLVSILKDSDRGSNHFMNQMMPTLTGVIDLYKAAAESVVGLSGGGPSATWQPILENVIGSGKEVLDRYVGAKRDVDVSANKARSAEANAQAAAAQAASMQAQAAAYAAAAATRGPSGLNGAPVQGQVATSAPPQAAAAPAPAQDNVVPIRAAAKEVTPAVAADMERFGKAYEQIKKLREVVKSGTVPPDKAIDMILQGVSFISANNAKNPPGSPDHIRVPAFTLYEEERWADFIDAVIPEAAAPYREECVRILTEDLEDDTPDGQQEDPDLKV